MSAFFSKADVKERPFRLSPNVRFRPEAAVQHDPDTHILNVCFRESRRSCLRITRLLRRRIATSVVDIHIHKRLPI